MRASAQKALVFHASAFNVSKLLKPKFKTLEPYFASDLGAIFDGDCLEYLPTLRDGVVDTVFADPPFNLKKTYGAKSNDSRSEEQYLSWCYEWLDQCIRVLKPGGALFLYNIPKWNIHLGAYLMRKGLDFRHAIAIDMKNGLPIQGKLYPSHYSLLYFTKGKPKTFRRIRTPIERCRHCDGEIKDYGGHRNAMNPKGVNLKDIWTDIPPVRHKKFKSSDRQANALSTKILDRVIEISTGVGDLVLDPFGGSGTTFAVCEQKNRHWIGMEIDFADVIKARIEKGDIQHHRNDDYIEG